LHMAIPDAALKDIPERTVAYLKCKGPWRQLPEMIARLDGLISERGFKPIGPPGGTYYSTPGQTAVEKLEWEVFRPIQPETPDAAYDTTGFGVKKLGPMRSAAAIHRGSFRKTAPIYTALRQWMDKRALKICGPNEEVYLTGIGENPDETEIEIRFPVC